MKRRTKRGFTPEKKGEKCPRGEAKSAPDKDPDARDPISHNPHHSVNSSEPLHHDSHSILFVRSSLFPPIGFGFPINAKRVNS